MPNEFIIETRKLSYSFASQKVLNEVSLQVPSGSIYGFLGPNGAGKTTTIKILLNLLRSDKNNVLLFGEEINKNRLKILSRIGALVEQPAIYSHLTGRENLNNRAMLLGIPKKRIDVVQNITGIDDYAGKKAGKYSLGMKQRLGIALALLPDPELLLLDEPTNGLDPNGIIEIRKLLQKLTSEGKTVFVSSHILSEVEKMATHVGIINHGKLLFQGSIAHLHDISINTISIEVNNVVDAANMLLNKGYTADIKNESIILPYSSQREMSCINKLLVDSGFSVFGLSRPKNDLETMFLNITKN